MYYVKDIICRKINGVRSKHADLLAENLIKVASNHITENAYNEFNELVFNAIDAIKIKNNSNSDTIGKFGFGFYSIFKHIYGKPNNKIIIDSTYNDGGLKSFQAVITDKSTGDLMVELSIMEPINSRTGTKISVYAPLSHDFIFLSLKDTIEYFEDIPVYFQYDVSDENKNHGCSGFYVDKQCKPGIRYLINTSCQQNCDDTIEIFMDYKKSFVVTDTGVGISCETLFDSMLIPSISSKTIINKKAIVPNYYNRTGIFPGGICDDAFSMIVGSMKVYHSEIGYSHEKNHKYLISMPSGTTVSLARNDIVLDGPEIVEIFENNLRKLVNDTLEYSSDLTTLWYYFSCYMKFTQCIQNKLSTMKIMNETLARNDLLFVSMDSDLLQVIVSLLPQHNTRKIVSFHEANLYDFEEFILFNNASYINKYVYWGKNVLILPNLENNISSFGFPSLLFIKESFTKQNPTWISDLSLSYQGDRLYPHIASNILKEKQSFIKMAVSGALTGFYNEICSIYIAMCGCLPDFHNMDIDKHFGDVMISIRVLNSGMSQDNMRIYLRSLYDLYSKVKTDSSYGVNRKFVISYPCGITSYRNGDDCSNVDLPIILFLTKEGFNHKCLCNPTYLFRNNYNKINSVGKLLFKFCDANNVSPREELIMREICLNFKNKEIFRSESSFDYLLNEIRSRFPHTILDKFFNKTIFIGKDCITHFLCEPLIVSLSIYHETYHISRDLHNCINYEDLIVPYDEKHLNVFTGKQVFNMIFSGNTDLIMAPNYSKESRFQIFDAVVNTGTTKDYISAVLTELVQNSIDAIRESCCNDKYISIGISNHHDQNILYFNDFVGISPDKIIYMLVPFLSSKTSAKYTGFMGTGLFNIYRQPYCQKVLIQTITETHITTLQCVPILANNGVVDINYGYYCGENINRVSPGTFFLIFLNGDTKTINQLSVDTSLFVHNAINTVDYPIIFNQQPLTKTSRNLIYEDEKIKIIHCPTIPSYILTNGVPFLPFNSNECYYENSCLFTGFIFDIKPGYYKSYQSRTKTQFNELFSLKDYVNTTNVWCIANDIFPVKVSRDMIPFIDSPVDYTQCKLSRLYYSDVSARFTYGDVCVIESINFIINKLNGRKPTWHLIKNLIPNFYPQIYVDCIWKWFSNKKAPKSKHSTHHNVTTGSNLNYLQRFVNIYWSIGLFLETEKIVTGTSFNLHNKPPAVFLGNDQSAFGYYSGVAHTIHISTKYFDIISYESAINKLLSINNLNERQIFIREHPFLFEVFAITNPLNTLLHELTHAHRNNSHHCPHDKIDLIIRGTSKTYSFDEAGSLVTSLIAEYGLYSKFVDFANEY